MAKSISLPEPGHRQEIEPSHANEDLNLILMTLETIKIMKPGTWSMMHQIFQMTTVKNSELQRTDVLDWNYLKIWQSSKACQLLFKPSITDNTKVCFDKIWFILFQSICLNSFISIIHHLLNVGLLISCENFKRFTRT